MKYHYYKNINNNENIYLNLKYINNNYNNKNIPSYIIMNNNDKMRNFF